MSGFGGVLVGFWWGKGIYLVYKLKNGIKLINKNMKQLTKEPKEFSDSSKMRSVVCSFFNLKLKGYWSGSSHGYHPRGILRNGICFQDDWNTNNYTWIYIGEKPDVKWTEAEDYPTAYHSQATIEPVNGKKIKVWGFSKWQTDDKNIKRKIIDTFIQLKAELKIAQLEKQQKEKKEKQEKQEKQTDFQKEVSNNWS